MISFHYGPLEEFGGWYSNMHPEYLDENGNWVPIEATVRDDAVLIHWHKYTKAVSAFISITELKVYEAE